MSARPETPAQFAKAVLSLYRELVASDGNPVTMSDHAPEVRQVAVGLATIHDALADRLAMVKASGDPRLLPESGIVEARAILESLTTGRDSGIWEYMAGLRTLTRPQNAPPTNHEVLARAVLVGLVRALQQATGTSESDAVRRVLEATALEGQPITVEQVRAWNRRFRETQDPAPDGHAQAIRQQAERISYPPVLSDRILSVGRQMFWRVRGALKQHSRSAGQ